MLLATASSFYLSLIVYEKPVGFLLIRCCSENTFSRISTWKLDGCGQNLAERWGSEKNEWIKFLATSIQRYLSKGPKSKFFSEIFLSVMNITYHFGHSRFTNFHEACNKYVSL